jgi:hypothetical protein
MTIFAISISLIACKKETVSPNGERAVEETQSVAGGLINPSQTYRLAKRGGDSVFYDNSNRLSKVQTPTNTTIYTYSGNTIIAKTYAGRLMTNEVVYTLNANGKASQSNHTDYSGALISMKSWMYEYDAKGKLKKRYNKSLPNERTEYKYDSTNNLERIMWFNANEPANIQKQYLPKYKISYKDAFLSDKLKLNPHFSELDQYLKIFGTFSKYLPVHVMYQQDGVINHEYLKYKFNSDGYLTSHDETYMGQFVRTVNYGYYATR